MKQNYREELFTKKEKTSPDCRYSFDTNHYHFIYLFKIKEYYLKNNTTYTTKKIKEVNKHLGYFKKHKRYMGYSRYKQNGWPIGSGVIEAACKSVVKQRMCRSGQRWSIKGGQAILNIRTVVKSERWDNFWSEFTNKYYTKSAT